MKFDFRLALLYSIEQEAHKRWHNINIFLATSKTESVYDGSLFLKFKTHLKQRNKFSLKCCKHFSHSNSLYKALRCRVKNCMICSHIRDNRGYSTKICRQNIE